METISRAQVLAMRWHVQQVDREPGATDCDLLDYGVQDTGPDGAPWALQIRGVDRSDDALAVAWTIRGAPHYYRRADLAQVAVAVSPLSPEDAGKRIYDASKKFKDAGTDPLEAMAELSVEMRKIVTTPTVKGEMSRKLTSVLPDHFLRYCKPCDAIHPYENSFRLAAIQAGLELQPHTSPPILQRIKGLRPNHFRHLGAEAAERFDVIRNYLRFYGAATPKQVSEYLDAPVRDIKAHWPTDVVDVLVDGQTRSALAGTLQVLTDPPEPSGLRLVGPYDPLLQARDRELLMPDAARRKATWPVLGRPGVIFSAAEPIGTWRPAKAGKKLNITVELWAKTNRAINAAIEEQAARLARFRGLDLGTVTPR
jgi:hypothetical protein